MISERDLKPWLVRHFLKSSVYCHEHGVASRHAAQRRVPLAVGM